MIYLLIPFLSQALLLGSINYHFDTRANQNYSGKLTNELHLSPMIGLESNNQVNFIGLNSIHQPIIGYYKRYNYFILGMYIQDTSQFKKKNINYFLDSWVIPILGLEYKYKNLGLVVSPVTVSFYMEISE